MLSANYDYCRSNREILRLPIQIKLSKKPLTFCYIFFVFLGFRLNSNALKKKDPHR